MKVLLDDEDVGLAEQVSCRLSTEKIARDPFMRQDLFVLHKVCSLVVLTLINAKFFDPSILILVSKNYEATPVPHYFLFPASIEHNDNVNSGGVVL